MGQILESKKALSIPGQFPGSVQDDHLVAGIIKECLPYSAIRKMACSFGSDWGPQLPNARIWKPLVFEK